MKTLGILLCAGAAVATSGCAGKLKPYYISLSEGEAFAAQAPDPTPHVVAGQAPASDITRFLLQEPVETASTAGIHDTVPLPPLTSKACQRLARLILPELGDEKAIPALQAFANGSAPEERRDLARRARARR